MPLDRHARALLDLQAMTGFKGFDAMPVAEARAATAARTAETPRAEVARVEDRTTPGGVPIRLYWPEAGGPPRPLLVFSHGGGWVVGNVETVDHSCRTLANASGCVVASVDYRLSPEHTFPAAADDAYEAYRWLRSEAGSIGVDPGRVAVGGDSAGGNLALVSCLKARELGEPMPAFQLLIYPVVDASCSSASYAECGTGFGLTAEAMRYYWRQYLARPEDGEHPLASPLRADLAGLPPAFVLSAEYDPLRDEVEELARRLRSGGVPTTLRRFDGQIHGFFHLGHIIPDGARALDEAAAALRTALDAPPLGGTAAAAK
ncbi:alpha/beta hydrolase [Tautonia plasticadhaerens]|uniref:Carboxylesterase NlhH n=1 Tax=Tautonia plasticadhaerens TaxID=2527974 RepID=A0A518H3N6_9BACT|nr:alpha/beta hydrolase [Tautonia plasticadhaerens]QDV35464.1 Carboxylesterase NlhH [Tautonia plasticadhaerens]